MYEEHDNEGNTEELAEIEEKAIEVGIPEDIRDIIIRNDIIIGKHDNSHL